MGNFEYSHYFSAYVTSEISCFNQNTSGGYNDSMIQILLNITKKCCFKIFIPLSIKTCQIPKVRTLFFTMLDFLTD